MLAFLRRLIRLRAVQRGILGGSTFWTGVFGLMTGWRLFKRLTDPTPRTLLTEELRPGQTIVVAHGMVPVDDARPARRRRRRRAAAAR